MAVRFKKGIDWDYYGVDILNYEYLDPKFCPKKTKDTFINTDELREELQKEGIDKDAVRKRFMGIE